MIRQFALRLVCSAGNSILGGLLMGLAVTPVHGQAGTATARAFKEDRPRDVSITEQTNARLMLRNGVVTDPKLLITVFEWRCSQLTWNSKVNDAADSNHCVAHSPCAHAAFRRLSAEQPGV